MNKETLRSWMAKIRVSWFPGIPSVHSKMLGTQQ